MQGDFRLGDWLIRPQLNRIDGKGGQVSRVEPKAMEVLACLARNSGEVLPKEGIIQAVWPDAFVTDDVLAHAISELRKAFGDDAREPRVIQTIPRRGYRLMVPVSEVGVSERSDPGRLASQRPSVHKSTLRRVAVLVIILARSAERVLQHARMDSREDFHEWACFSAQQAAERALKALFQHLNAEVWGHSVKGLLENLPAECGAREELVDCGRILDRFYIPRPLDFGLCRNGLVLLNEVGIDFDAQTGAGRDLDLSIVD